jgi:Concanavalin A-like lectin/glucanases superfamily/Peptide-N-glycosidase F, C terminal/Secretion system C-terminal sorting domain
MKKKYTLTQTIYWFVILLLGCQSFRTAAQSNQYLHFDKVDDFVSIPNASQYVANSNAVTIAGWFYCDELSYGQGMMGFRNGGTGNGEMYMIQLADGKLENRYITTAAFSEYVSPNFTVLPQVWQHYAWIYTGTQVQLWLNGNMVGSSNSNSGPMTAMDKPFSIGSLISPWNFYFGGRIDEVSVWSKALSQTEIQDMMANELTGNEANLELYFKFNQGVPGEDNTSITKLTCEVGGGTRDGDLNNFALTGETSNFGGELDNSFQAITFPQIGDKLISDAPFTLDAAASSGLPVSYTIVSGPATVSGNTVTLNGTVGQVVVRASQPGDGTFNAAVDIENSFMVLDPNTFVPDTEARSPLDNKDVWVPELGPIQLACISNIGSPQLFNVANVVFEIDGTTVAAKDHGNEHYTGWWTPPAYGTYTMDIIATNNYGASSTTSVTFEVVDQMSDITSNAATDVHLNINVGSQTVSAELPCYMGAFDNIIANLKIECPAGGCDPWDRVSGVEVKGHNGTWYEIIRYITPYGVACNHSVDLTDFMSLLQGKVDFRFYLGTQGNGFLYTLDFDYGGGVPTHKYSSVEKLWNETLDFGNPANLQPAGVINASYPDNVLASKIKLVATGHGWGDNNTGNAAEFHEDTHHIWVNGAETFSQHNWLDCNPNPDACSPQNGTWQFDRAGWCPGTIAPWFDFDMTPFVAGDDVELKYILNEDYEDLCHPNNPDCVSGVTCPNCNEGFNPHLITASYLISLGDNPIDQPAVSTGVNNLARVDFDIYPNPSSGTFTVEFDAAIEVKGIRVLNSLGQVVRVFNSERNTTVRILHLEDMPKGIYFVELLSVRGMGMKKVVIE